MPVTVNSSDSKLTQLVALIFESISTVNMSTSYRPINFVICSGSIPSSPSEGAVTAITAITTLPATPWLPPSAGVIDLATGLTATITTAGTPSFIRFLSSTTIATGMFDLSLGVAGSGHPAICDRVDNLTVGSLLNISSVRMQMPTTGPICVSPNIANGFLGKLTNQLYVPKVKNFSKNTFPTSTDFIPFKVEAWDGPIPPNSSATPIGRKLWSGDVSGVNGQRLFTPTGFGVVKNTATNVSGTVLLTGTPTFVRIVNSAYSTEEGVTMQAPIGDSTGVALSEVNLVQGTTVSLTSFTISFIP